MISNVKKDIDDDLDNLDGFDELEAEDQERLRQAFADGHVADEDIVSIVCTSPLLA